jgi:predicted nuclease of restriction endonuclease-like (RecB) superfamily
MDTWLQGGRNMVMLNETRAGNAAEFAWVSRLQVFILELGYGFCFVGRPHLQRIVWGIGKGRTS